jgi:hypothetical protein
MVKLALVMAELDGVICSHPLDPATINGAIGIGSHNVST